MLNTKQFLLFRPTGRIRFSFMVMTIILYSCVPALSQSPTANQELSSQEYAFKLLKHMSESIQSFPQFGYHLDIIDEYNYDGVILHLEKTVDLVMKRGTGILVDIKDDYNHKRFWYDNKNITLLTVPANLYAVAEISGSTDEMLDLLIDEVNITIPMADFLYSDPFKILTENIDEAYYAGLHRVENTPCHHLVFIQENIDWQIWIEDGHRALPRKILITYKNEEGQPKQAVKIDNWNFAPLTSDKSFEFVPPPGSMEIEFLVNSK